jgi:hypothetical protein
VYPLEGTTMTQKTNASEKSNELSFFTESGLTLIAFLLLLLVL